MEVELTPSALRVRLWDLDVMAGKLSQPIKQEASIWVVQDGIVHLQLLKRNRRGHYANGCTNADTFWRGVFATGGPEETVPSQHAPSCYYSSFVEPDDVPILQGKRALLAQAAYSRQVEA